MKKLLSLFLGMIITVMMSINVAAAEATITHTQEINLSKDQREFTINITVNNKDKYAGAEFGLQLGDGVSVKSVSYDVKNASTAGPVKAQGLTWFSFFSGENDFSNKVKATVTLEYTESKNTSIVVDNVSVYIADGHTVNSTNINDRTNININREGSSEVAPPLTPPEDNGSNNESDSESGSGSGSGSGSDSGTGSGSGSGSGSNSESGSSSQATNNLASNKTDKDTNSEDVNDSESDDEDNNKENADNENTSEKDKNDNNNKENNSNESESETNTNLGSGKQNNILIIVLGIILVISIGVNVVLILNKKK